MSTKDFAESLLTELEEALCDYEHGTGVIYRTNALARLEKAREDILQALRVPSPHSEDFPTPRDEFAMKALQGGIAYDGLEGNDVKAFAQMAYEYADAMMKAREVKP